MDDELSILFDSVWVDIPEELVVRMVDIIKAVARGVESGFLIAEAGHVKLQLDALMLGVVPLPYELAEHDEGSFDDEE